LAPQVISNLENYDKLSLKGRKIILAETLWLVGS